MNTIPRAITWSMQLSSQSRHSVICTTKCTILNEGKKKNNKKFQDSVAVACSSSKAQKSSVSQTGFTQFQEVLVKMQKDNYNLFLFLFK